MVDLGKSWVDLWYKSCIALHNFNSTTQRIEKGDRAQWKLIDTFEFLELISPRMHQEKWISRSYPSSPSLSLCLHLYWYFVKPCMNCYILNQAIHLRFSSDVITSHQAACQTTRAETWDTELKLLTNTHLIHRWKKKKLPRALNTMLTFTQSYWNERQEKN